MTKSRFDMFGAWCAIYYVSLLCIGWWAIAGFVPPISPSAGAEEAAALFQDNTLRIRIGMVITMYAAAIFIPFGALLAKYVSRIEDGPGVLTYTIVLGAVGNMVLTFYPPVWWLTAAFRPERAAELIYLFNDMSWLQFIGGISIFLPLPIVVAVAAFVDKSENPVFPRWSGYLNIWIAILILPDQLLFFFHDGPFAWNGLIAFWIPVTLFFLWFMVMFYLLRKAVLRERASLS